MKIDYINYLKKVFFLNIPNSSIYCQDSFVKADIGISCCNASIIKINDKFYVHLFNLKTNETFRNLGCATQLIDAVKKYSIVMNCVGVHLYCKPELVEFYKKRGFNKVDTYLYHIEMIWNKE